MNEQIERFNQKELSGRDARLLQEWVGLDALFCKRKLESANSNRPSISYIIRRKNPQGLPTEYEIWYRCKSIVGVKEGTIPREPIFGYLHKMRIELPSNYPSADGNPVFTFLTTIWHPNIRHSGSFKGRVCLTIKEMGVLASLKTLVLRVEQYLKWQLYHANNTYPYPEDQNVAEWVREEGEPNGWIHFGQDMNEAGRRIKPKTEETTENVVPKKKITII
jgi:ubiquitin-protein ligase